MCTSGSRLDCSIAVLTTQSKSRTMHRATHFSPCSRKVEASSDASRLIDSIEGVKYAPKIALESDAQHPAEQSTSGTTTNVRSTEKIETPSSTEHVVSNAASATKDATVDAVSSEVATLRSDRDRLNLKLVVEVKS